MRPFIITIFRLLSNEITVVRALRSLRHDFVIWSSSLLISRCVGVVEVVEVGVSVVVELIVLVWVGHYVLTGQTKSLKIKMITANILLKRL